ncbi:MAG TPA: hypothetical protein VEL07_20140 [Planctomycetota bacterium]|nr:hypothetical protein [Planctomycetota bacterium]
MLRLIKWVVGVGLVLGVGVTAFVATVNWRSDGEFSLRVFDRTWWQAGRTEAQPLIDSASATAKEAYSAIWDEGGLVDQAEDWLKDTRERRAQPPVEAKADPAGVAPEGTPPPVAQKPERSKATRQIEERLDAAEELFEKGVGHYQSGDPSKTGYDASIKRELAAAKDCFKQVRDILDQQLDRYEQMPDHDPLRLSDARRMQHLNSQMLFNAGKMGGGL